MDTDLDRAAALRQLGRFDDALIAVDKALAVDPTNAVAFLERARILLAADQDAEALAAAEASLSLEITVPALHVAAIACRSLGDHQQSLELIDRALALQPESALLHVGRALTLVTRGDPDLAGARASAVTASSLDPALPSPHYALALCALGQPDLPGAARHLSDALERNPDWAEAHRLMGTVRAKQGMARLASRHLAAAGALDPDDGRSLGLLRLINAFGRGRRERKTVNPRLVPEARRIMAVDLDLS